MFNDEELNKKVKESSTLTALYLVRLYKISEDIKTMEELFKKSGIGRFGITIDKGHELGFENSRIQYYTAHENQKKPLIEHKAGVRMKAAQFFPDLFDKYLLTLKLGIGKE